MLLKGYARSPIRDFESYLRIVIGLDEDDIQLFSKQYIIQISLLLKYHLVFTRLKILQSL